MKYNIDYGKKNYIELNKNKFTFIGFIIGITPFIIILGLISFYEGGIKYKPSLFKDTIVIFGLITSLINGIIVRIKLSNKIK